MEFNWDLYGDEYNMFMRDLRSKGRMPGRTGGMTSFPGLFIYAVARQTNAKKILEVGTRNGISAATFCRAINENHGHGVLITCDVVDVLKGEARAVDENCVFPLTPDKMITAVGDGNIDVHFVQKKGAQVLPDVPKESLDLILLDGSHKEGDVYLEVPLALRALKDGGVLLLDDVYPNGEKLKAHQKVIPGPWRALKQLIDDGLIGGFVQPNPDFSVAYIIP